MLLPPYIEVLKNRVFRSFAPGDKKKFPDDSGVFQLDLVPYHKSNMVINFLGKTSCQC